MKRIMEDDSNFTKNIERFGSLFTYVGGFSPSWHDPLVEPWKNLFMGDVQKVKERIENLDKSALQISH